MGDDANIEVWKRWPNDLAIFHRKHGPRPCHMVNFVYPPDPVATTTTDDSGKFMDFVENFNLGVFWIEWVNVRHAFDF